MSNYTTDEMLLNIGDVCGYIAGVLTVLSLFPQIFTMFKTKNPEGISLLMIISLWIVSVLNFVYGIIIYSIPIFLTNIFTTILWTIIFILKIYYAQRKTWNAIGVIYNDGAIYGSV